MVNDLINKLKNEFEHDINELGYELVDIEFKTESGENFLRFFIYNEEGITIEDCEKVSKFLDVKLDELDPINKQYYLEVSSPDLNRPLKTDDDLRRNLGTIVEVGLYKKINGSKNYQGELISYDDDSITLEIDEEEVKLERKDISIIKVAIIF
ncbi:ribosome maturation factor RimP [Helcococcus kunzii]|uniref:ribosome maturation factor RimP n=1 Tax=Helcococcus kunzii TaxID=40091 RepID=UPI0024AD40B5|nr:ribosome maturation factor RimP [Helcococcus kunzii]